MLQMPVTRASAASQRVSNAPDSSKTDALFSQIDSATGTRTDGQRKQIAQAHAFYEAYAYPDAYRTAAAVLGGK